MPPFSKYIKFGHKFGIWIQLVATLTNLRTKA